MKYATQKLAYPYIVVALALFAVQVLFGALAGTVYVVPHFLSELLPFNILRMIHTNALIFWTLLGFFAAAYYLIPEESETEIFSPMLAYVQLGILVIGGLAAIIGYLFRIHEGREFLEQPLWVKGGIVIAALLFLFNITVTVLKGRKTAITNVLLLGLWGTALFFLFALYNPTNLALDKMYWWYVVHIWVEGVWELVMASVLGFLMIKLTGIDREVVEKWLYVIVGLALFSGLLGTGHHYYWIGTPGYWQWIGSIFSTFEIAPFFAMVVFVFTMVWKGGREHPNTAALLWALGCAVAAFLGAGVWGFMHTLSFVNFYTHGTQITAAHGHHAFYGAYVMLNLAMFTYVMPHLRGHRLPYNQILNMWSFWIMTSAVFFMTFTLTFAGVVQTHLQRVLGMGYMEVQDQLALFYWMRLGAGLFVVLAAGMFIYALLGPAKEEEPVHIERHPEVTEGETV
ncbi:MAG TPA: cbb3-type cytochrome c oxidase subunit I [Candidatus Competibacteraceae bacterium]|nr:cbb3-type cytochrome c oxidase subunit I [Candidatus Competibacteraceae bacterium]